MHNSQIFSYRLALVVGGLIILSVFLGSNARAGLVHNWTFDGDLTDTVGGQDAVATGDAGVDMITTKIGTGSARFDGVGDYMQAGVNTDFVIGTGSMSVSFWYKSDTPQNSDRFLGTGSSVDSGDPGWVFFMDTTLSKVAGGMSDGSGRRIQKTDGNASVSPLDNDWHLLVGVFDHNAGDGSVDVYLDGILETTTPLDDLGSWSVNSIGNSEVLVLGARPDIPSQNQFDGHLDDVAIWDHGLSQQTVNTLWNGGLGRSAASVPEPSTLTLLSVVCMGFAVSRRRKARRPRGSSS